MDEFEVLLEAGRGTLERFVRYRVNSPTDAEDIISEVYLAAWKNFSNLKNRDVFMGWLITIARNKCNDYFRRKADVTPLSLDENQLFRRGRQGITLTQTVRDTVDSLSVNDREVLRLYFWEDMRLKKIGECLNIPLGTVKSRLHTAKENFRKLYPYRTEREDFADMKKGYDNMKKLPRVLPEYSIKVVNAPLFPVRWEELIGMFIVPKLGESCTFGCYDMPKGNLTEYSDLAVTGKCSVHGIEGVEIALKERIDESGYERDDTFVAQLTETHCRYLAHSYTSDDGVKHIITFLDGDGFLPDWGLGEDNIGVPVNICDCSGIKRTGDTVECERGVESIGAVSRCEVIIGGKTYDTVCVMDVRDDVKTLTEQYIDINGRTVLWRRFNGDTWAINRFGERWSEMLPENERLFVNGETYVHWYDSITDYIL